MAAILAIFILYLAVKPCADGLVDQVRHQTEQVADNANHAHDHGQDAKDDCTPLCSCHCCHIHLLVKENTASIARPDVTVHAQRYIENLSQEVNRSILQPPRI